MNTETTSRELRQEQVKAFNFWRAIRRSANTTEARILQAEMRVIRANRESLEHAAAALEEAQENHEYALENGDDYEFKGSRLLLQRAEDNYRQANAFCQHYDRLRDEHYAGDRS